MKHLAWMLTLVMLLAAPCHYAAAEGFGPDWYELSGDVITIRLPAEADGEWAYRLSHPELLELLTCEYDEAAGIYAASFRNFSENAGQVDLRMRNTATGECCGVLANVCEGGAAIDGTYVSSENMLTFRIKTNPSTGYAWSCAVSDPSAAQPMIESVMDPAQNDMLVGAGATYILAVSRAEGAGEFRLTLSYGRSWEAVPAKVYTLDF